MLAVVHTIALALITGFVTRVLRQLPMLALALQSITRGAEIEGLPSGEIDECFCTDPIAGNTKIATEMFREQPLLASTRTRLGEPDLGFAFRPGGTSIRHCEFRTRVTTHLGECAVIMIPRFRSEREDLIRQAAAKGADVCLLPECSAIVDGPGIRRRRRHCVARREH